MQNAEGLFPTIKEFWVVFLFVCFSWLIFFFLTFHYSLGNYKTHLKQPIHIRIICIYQKYIKNIVKVCAYQFRV